MLPFALAVRSCNILYAQVMRGDREIRNELMLGQAEDEGAL